MSIEVTLEGLSVFNVPALEGIGLGYSENNLDAKIQLQQKMKDLSIFYIGMQPEQSKTPIEMAIRAIRAIRADGSCDLVPIPFVNDRPNFQKNEAQNQTMSDEGLILEEKGAPSSGVILGIDETMALYWTPRDE